MKCYAITHTGLVRDGNEDSYFVPENGENFAIVCDGMGGHNAGEVASGQAISSMRAHLAGKSASIGALHDAIERANGDVLEMAMDNVAYMGMGTTLTAIWWDESSVLMGHVGDSRLYIFDGGKFIQLSHDHTYVQELVDMGEITEKQARVHPRKNLITRAIGTREDVSIDMAEFKRRPGAKYLLCSDGLTNMLEDDEISAILGLQDPARELDELLKKALERGGTDNITALLAIDAEDEA